MVHPLTKHCPRRLQEASPDSLPVDELLENTATEVAASGVGQLADQRNIALDEWFHMVAAQQLDVLAEAVETSDQASIERPAEGLQANQLAYQQARLVWPHTTASAHRTLRFDTFVREMLLLMEAERKRETLLRELGEQFQDGGRLRKLSTPGTSAKQLQKQISANFDRLTTLLRRNSLLGLRPGSEG